MNVVVAVREGIALWGSGLSPYAGDVFHEVPYIYDIYDQ